MRITPILPILIASLVCFFLRPGAASAVNLGAAYRSGPGYSLKLYSHYYAADTRSDKDGHPAVTDAGARESGVAVGNSLQVGDFQVNLIIPVSKVEVDKLNQSDSGLGDILLSAGWFLPVTSVNILPAVGVKIPTGSFDRGRAVNVGDGQTDLMAGIYLFKLMQPLSFDAVVKYSVRLHNRESDITPGNEFSAESLVTLRLAEGIRIGPALNYAVGADNRKGGRTVADSGFMRLSAGGELYYGRFPDVKISLAAYKDLVTRNSFEGVLVLSRVVFVF